MVTMEKQWDAHVIDAEEVARTPGFCDLRERLLALASPQAGDVVVDVGAGTGLLSLALAEQGLEVWAVDISPAMCDYLRSKAASAGHEQLRVCVGSAVSLPLVDRSADLVVSNYCFHHLSDDDKRRALAEVRRVLRPGGRLVFGDMMFTLRLVEPRDRKVVVDKVRAMVRKGPAGVVRLARNGLRLAGGRWEHPAAAAWWEAELAASGFEDVRVDVLAHEGGIAVARRP